VALTKQVNHFAGALLSCLPGGTRRCAAGAGPVQDLRKHDIGIVKPMFWRGPISCAWKRAASTMSGSGRADGPDMIPLTKD
jgi:hypothetical protein